MDLQANKKEIRFDAIVQSIVITPILAVDMLFLSQYGWTQDWWIMASFYISIFLLYLIFWQLISIYSYAKKGAVIPKYCAVFLLVLVVGTCIGQGRYTIGTFRIFIYVYWLYIVKLYISTLFRKQRGVWN